MKPSRMVGMLLAALFVFYILSPGPVQRHYEMRRWATGEPMPAPVRAFFFPLAWTCQHVPVVEKAYQLYFELWLKHPHLQ
jgi:hypothetical protein